MNKIEQYHQLRLQRSQAFCDDNNALEAQLDKQLEAFAATLTKEDIEEMLKQSHNYLEKIYWSNKLKEKKWL